MKRKRFIDDFLSTTFVIFLGITFIFLIFPIGVTLLMSFDSREYLGVFPPTGFSLKWYAGFFGTDRYVKALINSISVACIAATLATVIGTSTAVFLSRHRFPGINFLLALFLSPLLVPGVIIGFSLLVTLSSINLYDGFTRLILGHLIVTLPYTIRTTLASLESINPRFVEAALSLGANERSAFWDITLPLAKTGIVAGGILAFALSMDEIALSVFLVDPFSTTLPVALLSNMRGQFDLTLAAASGVLVFFTVLLIILLDKLLGLDRIAGLGVYTVVRPKQ